MFTSPNKLPISVAILADQMSELLITAVTSVGWADEIMIVDSHHNLELRDFPDSVSRRRILPIEQLTDFAAARNFALKQAKHDWVFFLDSDEHFVAPVSQVVSELSEIIQGKWSAASFVRRDVFYGQELRWGELLGQRHTRLLNRTSSHFTRPVHEVVVATGQIKRSSLVLLHHPHPDIATFLEAVNRYAQREALLRPEFTSTTLYQLWLWPVAKWWMNVIIKAAWIDGWRGIVYATMMSWHSWLVRSYQYARTTPQKS